MSESAPMKDAAASGSGNLKDKVKSESRQLAGEVKSTASKMARDQRDALGDYVAALSRAAIRAAEDLEASGYARSASTVAHTAEEIDSFASRMQAREPAEVWRDVEDFARAHPAVVFGAGFALAFGVTRFLKSSSEPRDMDDIDDMDLDDDRWDQPEGHGYQSDL